MNTTQLECFLSVANYLNFARAAQELHITQPAVTHQISSLEAELDAKLFIRSTRSVRLTHEGWTFLNDAKNILNLSYGAKARLSRKSEEEMEILRIGFYSAIELGPISSALKALRLRWPRLHPTLSLVPFKNFRSLLEEGTYDLIASFQEKKNKGEPDRFIQLYPSSAACVLPSSHPLASRSSLSMEDLQQESIILCNPRTNPPPIVELQGRMIGSRRSDDLFFAETPLAALALARAGFGFTLLPVLNTVHFPDLSYIPLEEPVVLSYGAYCSDSFRDKPLVRDFLEEMRRVFQNA